jgi:AraC-like DNA-binding protein
MKLYLKYDINKAYKKILEDQLDSLDLSYTLIAFGEVDVRQDIPKLKLKELELRLNEYGIEIVESQRSVMIQKIKDAIVEMVYMDEKLPTSKISTFLAQKLKHSYGYISNLFSDVTYNSIEKYIILQKIERAKQLIITNDFNYTEIAWKLNYSSVAHFSTQFKNTTGLTPTAFKRIISKRRNLG